MLRLYRRQIKTLFVRHKANKKPYGNPHSASRHSAYRYRGHLAHQADSISSRVGDRTDRTCRHCRRHGSSKSVGPLVKRHPIATRDYGSCR